MNIFATQPRLGRRYDICNRSVSLRTSTYRGLRSIGSLSHRLALLPNHPLRHNNNNNNNRSLPLPPIKSSSADSNPSTKPTPRLASDSDASQIMEVLARETDFQTIPGKLLTDWCNQWGINNTRNVYKNVLRARLMRELRKDVGLVVYGRDPEMKDDEEDGEDGERMGIDGEQQQQQGGGGTGTYINPFLSIGGTTGENEEGEGGEGEGEYIPSFHPFLLTNKALAVLLIDRGFAVPLNQGITTTTTIMDTTQQEKNKQHPEQQLSADDATNNIDRLTAEVLAMACLEVEGKLAATRWTEGSFYYYEKMYMADLKKLCTQRRIESSGVKAEVIERLHKDDIKKKSERAKALHTGGLSVDAKEELRAPPMKEERSRVEVVRLARKYRNVDKLPVQHLRAQLLEESEPIFGTRAFLQARLKACLRVKVLKALNPSRSSSNSSSSSSSQTFNTLESSAQNAVRLLGFRDVIAELAERGIMYNESDVAPEHMMHITGMVLDKIYSLKSSREVAEMELTDLLENKDAAMAYLADLRESEIERLVAEMNAYGVDNTEEDEEEEEVEEGMDDILQRLEDTQEKNDIDIGREELQRRKQAWNEAEQRLNELREVLNAFIAGNGDTTSPRGRAQLKQIEAAEKDIEASKDYCSKLRTHMQYAEKNERLIKSVADQRTLIYLDELKKYDLLEEQLDSFNDAPIRSAIASLVVSVVPEWIDNALNGRLGWVEEEDEDDEDGEEMYMLDSDDDEDDEEIEEDPVISVGILCGGQGSSERERHASLEAARLAVATLQSDTISGTLPPPTSSLSSLSSSNAAATIGVSPEFEFLERAYEFESLGDTSFSQPAVATTTTTTQTETSSNNSSSSTSKEVKQGIVTEVYYQLPSSLSPPSSSGGGGGWHLLTWSDLHTLTLPELEAKLSSATNTTTTTTSTGEELDFINESVDVVIPVGRVSGLPGPLSSKLCGGYASSSLASLASDRVAFVKYIRKLGFPSSPLLELSTDVLIDAANNNSNSSSSSSSSGGDPTTSVAYTSVTEWLEGQGFDAQTCRVAVRAEDAGGALISGIAVKGVAQVLLGSLGLLSSSSSSSSSSNVVDRIVLQAIHPEAKRIHVSVFAMTYEDGTQAPPAALPPVEVSTWDIEDWLLDADLELHRHNAIHNEGFDEASIDALVKLMKADAMLHPDHVGGPVRPSQRYRHTIPANLSPRMLASVQAAAVELFNKLEVIDHAEFSCWIVPSQPMQTNAKVVLEEIAQQRRAQGYGPVEEPPTSTRFEDILALEENEMASPTSAAPTLVSPVDLSSVDRQLAENPTALVKQPIVQYGEYNGISLDDRSRLDTIQEMDTATGMKNADEEGEEDKLTTPDVRKLPPFQDPLSGVDKSDPQALCCCPLDNASSSSSSKMAVISFDSISLIHNIAQPASALRQAAASIGLNVEDMLRSVISSAALRNGTSGLGLPIVEPCLDSSRPALYIGPDEEGYDTTKNRNTTSGGGNDDDDEDGVSLLSPAQQRMMTFGAQAWHPGDGTLLNNSMNFSLDAIGAFLARQPATPGQYARWKVGYDGWMVYTPTSGPDLVWTGKQLDNLLPVVEGEEGGEVEMGNEDRMVNRPLAAALGSNIDDDDEEEEGSGYGWRDEGTSQQNNNKPPPPPPAAAAAPPLSPQDELIHNLYESYPDMHPTKQKVWILFGGDGPDNDATVTAALHAVRSLSKDPELMVESFLLEPSYAGPDEETRRKILIQQRMEFKKIGIDDGQIEKDFRELDVARIKNPHPAVLSSSSAENDVMYKGVWRLSDCSQVRAGLDDLMHACHDASKAATVSLNSLSASSAEDLHRAYYHRAPLILQRIQDQLVEESQVPIGGAGAWGGVADATAVPSFNFLEQWVEEAARAGAIILPLLSPANALVQGELQMLLESNNIPFCGPSATIAAAAADRADIRMRILNSVIPRIINSSGSSGSNNSNSDSDTPCPEIETPPMVEVSQLKLMANCGLLLLSSRNDQHHHHQQQHETDNNDNDDGSHYSVLMDILEDNAHLAEEVFKEHYEELGAEQGLLIKPVKETGPSVGLASLANGSDLLIYLYAVREEWDAVPEGLLSQHPEGIPMALPAPDMFLLEPQPLIYPLTILRDTNGTIIPTNGTGGTTVTHNGTTGMEGKVRFGDEYNTWIEATACLLGSQGKMHCLSLTTTALDFQLIPEQQSPVDQGLEKLHKAFSSSSQGGGEAAIEEEENDEEEEYSNDDVIDREILGVVELTPPPTDILPPHILDATKSEISRIANDIGLSGAASIDLLLNPHDGHIAVQAVCTAPDLSQHSIFFRQAATMGLAPSRVFKEIVLASMTNVRREASSSLSSSSSSSSSMSGFNKSGLSGNESRFDTLIQQGIRGDGSEKGDFLVDVPPPEMDMDNSGKQQGPYGMAVQASYDSGEEVFNVFSKNDYTGGGGGGGGGVRLEREEEDPR